MLRQAARAQGETAQFCAVSPEPSLLAHITRFQTKYKASNLIIGHALKLDLNHTKSEPFCPRLVHTFTRRGLRHLYSLIV